MEQKETCRSPPKIPNFRVAGLDLSHMRAVTSVCKHPMSASVFWRFVPNSRILDRETLCIECANSYRPRKTWSKNKPGHSASAGSVGDSPCWSSESNFKNARPEVVERLGGTGTIRAIKKFHRLRRLCATVPSVVGFIKCIVFHNK